MRPQLTYSFQPHYSPGIYSALSRNEFQESSGVLKRHRLENITDTALCEAIV
jgi:hypothetical protein